MHTSVFVSFSPIHTKKVENGENDWDLGLLMYVLTSQDHPPSWVDAPIWSGTDGM